MKYVVVSDPLSVVECMTDKDVMDIKRLYPDATVYNKIESLPETAGMILTKKIEH